MSAPNRRSRRRIPTDGDLSRRAAVGLALMMCAVIVGGCMGPWRDRYFDRGINKLSQDEVSERLGPPHTAKTPALGGNTVWTYRFPMSDKELRPWDPSNLTVGPKTRSSPSPSPFGKSLPGSEEAYREPLYCYRYTLVFDESKMLKSWKREDCVPRSNDNDSTP